MIGRYLVDHSLVPDAVLCSTAVRTRATLALVLAEVRGARPAVTFEDALYLADPVTLQSLIQEAPDRARTLMVVAHNPGLHSLALALTGQGERKLIGAMAQEFPTAALAVLTFKASAWRDVGAALGTLDHFVTPRRITGD